jgi:hypothetical protein
LTEAATFRRRCHKQGTPKNRATLKTVFLIFILGFLMKKLRLVAFVSVSCAFVAAAPLVACSDDTSVNPPVDGGRTDGPTPGDSSTDTNVIDAPLDTADFDAGLKLDTIADTVSARMCNALARCCFGTPTPADGGADGGTFDRVACQNLYADLGFENSSVGHTLFTGGKVGLDQQKGKDCLDKIDALACSLTGAALQDIRTSCFAAIKGLATNGQACNQSVECATGLFCNPTGSGAFTGTCTALKTAGQPCGVFTGESVEKNAVRGEEACSYRGSGTPALHCDSLDDVGGYTDPATWTCKPTVANGQLCNSSVWCTSGICDPDTFLCTSPSQYFTKYSCEAQIITP